MKIYSYYFILLLLAPVLFLSCSSTGIPRQNVPAVGGLDVRPLQWIEQDVEERERQEREQQEQERIAQEQRERERYMREQRERERIAREQRERAERRHRTERILNNAEKNFHGFSGFFQWSENGPNTAGIEYDFYSSPVPFTSIGLNLRAGVLFENYAFSNTDGSHFSDGDLASDVIFVASPSLGLVFPLGNHARVFSNIALEIGFFPEEGIITSWITPSANAGLLLQTGIVRFLLRYRLIWYNNIHNNAISIGIAAVVP